MRIAVNLMTILFLAVTLTGCSGAFWGGTGAGVLGTGAGYEINAEQQMRKIDADLKNGKINQEEYNCSPSAKMRQIGVLN